MSLSELHKNQCWCSNYHCLIFNCVYIYVLCFYIYIYNGFFFIIIIIGWHNKHSRGFTSIYEVLEAATTRTSTCDEIYQEQKIKNQKMNLQCSFFYLFLFCVIKIDQNSVL